MKINDRFILDIKRLGINGEGIGFYNKLAVFVKNAIPGEGVDVEVTNVMPKMALAKIVDFKKVSPYRKDVKCPYYERCGACQVMHIDNNYTKILKRDLIVEAINRYTKLNPKSFEIKETINMENPYNYRNKATSSIRYIKGEVSLVMIEEGSNRVLPIENCLVLDDKINKINKKIVEIANIRKVLAQPQLGFSWRYLITRVSKSTRESLVCLVVKEYNSEIEEFAKSITKEKVCDSLYININSNLKGHNIFGDKTIYFSGKKSIIETIDKYRFNLYPSTFFQLNTTQTCNLYERVKKAAKLSHKEIVLDAFCGVGTIGIYLANLAKEVYGIEYNKESVEAAKENAKLNKVNNISFYQGSVVKLLPELLKKDIKFDVYVFDPPRTGLSKDVIDLIIKNPVKTILYVSCNPATLAKDLDLLSQSYKVNYIEPLDMFPQTSAVEAVVRLTYKE